ncbi:PAS domain S-box protein [Flavobacterium sp.]|uniref:PAS domain S-box protein n=1 Tax=Flavobacterium sp. TaxID=239 RepID=UPI0011F84C87|nr:PAS domain S-box protein [Flavobacterium sp.]RZJ71223.1 MAG: PAS domain S-box protein [Flavobacterium sp.]
MEYKTTGLHFLIVEDNSGDFVLICDYLSEVFENPACTRAGSYDQACDFIESHTFDAILLDLTLPDVSGEELLVALDPVSARIPVIVLTGSINTQFAYRALSYGVSDYLEKDGLTPLSLFKSITYSLERHRINRKLKRSEENYRNLFKMSPIPKWIYDVDTFAILDVNDAAIANYGYSRAEFLEMDIHEVHPDFQTVAVEAKSGSQHSASGHELQPGHYQHHRKNGETIDVQIQTNDIDFGGKRARMVISNDITEKIHTEKAILRSEQRFKTLVQESGDLITILDANGNCIYASPNHEAILGRKYTQMAQKHILDLIHIDDIPTVKEFYQGLSDENRIYSLPFRMRHISGRYLWMESIGTNALDDQSINGLVLNSRDVTPRVEHEKRLEEINERLTAIAKATSDAIYSYDYDTRQISLLGANYTSLFGYKFPEDTAPNDFFKDHIHPDDKVPVLEFLKNALLDKKNRHFEVEYRFRRQNGSYAYVLDRFDIIREKGVAAKKVGAMQDISARKMQETILSFEKQIYELNANPKVGFETVIRKLVTNIEELIPDSHCTILMLEDDGTTAKHIAGDSLGHDYAEAVSGLQIGPKAGSCGTAMYTGKKVIVTDIENDPLWKDYLDLAERFRLRACWSVPVKKANGKVVGSFATYYKAPKSPHPDEINLVERVAAMISILIENRISFEETERAKERYDIVAKATSDTIWDWNILEDKFEWNKGIQGVFGYKKTEVGNTSRWWFDRIHPEDSIKMAMKLYAFLEQKTEKWQDEYRFACADGSYKYVYDRAFLVKDESGKAIRMIGAMQDVTRTKAEEHRLKLMDTVITQMKDSVVIAEASKTDELPKVIFVNPSFTAMTGYKPLEVIGKRPTIFMNRKPNQREYDRLKLALSNKQEFRYEALNDRKNGEEYWTDVSITPIWNNAGEHTHWISIQRDITDEKRRDKEKEHLIRELTQNNKDLKQFSYITSHNLRAPLSNLTGLLNLIEDMPIENQDLKEILNGFHKSTHLLNETISDLVKVVIIKDNPSIQKEEVLIKDVFENVFNQLSFMIGMYKPIINLKIEKVSILNINKAYLESILLNLLTNAIKYRSPERKLKIFVSSKLVGDSVQLVFKDNGIGIDMERHHDKIFGLYQRFHNYPDSKGLGLYLVKSQVESMGGTIKVDSTVDKGTSFTLTFKKQTTI